MEKKDDNIIYITSHVNEIFASTELVQYFTNPLDNPIELTILFPIKEELSLSKFVVSMDDQIVLSKVMPKEKAEEKYSDTIASGNVGFISKYEEDNKTYSVNIGNIKPKKQIKLDSIFMQMIGAQDISYEFSIMDHYPAFYYKEAKKDDGPKTKKIVANFEIKTQSKITRLIAPFYDEKYKEDSNSTYSVKYGPDYKSAKIEFSKKEEDIIALLKKDAEGENPTFYSTFCILFRTENMNNPLLCTQYNPEFKETAYSINYIYTSKSLKQIPVPEKPDEDNTISYAAKYEENITNETPGLFIFLIDQSGSMSGKPIELVKQALLLFIQSLPEQSYFQLIGFGSDFKKYNKEPVEYNKENVDLTIKQINELKADLGGTNISGPLRAIYNDECYSKINLSRNIFLLTDGEVFDREQCIEIITANSSKFRLHSLGIGNDFDKKLIEQCGKLGKGTSSFVRDLEKINSVVIDVLNKGLRPYITDINFEFENYQDEIASNIIKVNPINNFTYQNEIMNYSFILPGNKELTDLKMKIKGKDPINPIEADVTFNNVLKLNDGEEMGKVIVGKALKNNKELTSDEQNELKFAKKYQILSKNTALFAEMINDDNQQSKLIKVELKKIQEKRDDYSPHSYLNFANYSYASNNLNSMNSIISKQGASPLIDRSYKIKGCCMAMPKKKKSLGINFNIFGGLKNIFASKKKGSSSSSNAKPEKIEVTAKYDYSAPKKDELSDNDNDDEDDDDYINISSAKPKSISNSNSNNDKKDDMTNLIMSQDIIEGSWSENDATKKLINIVTTNIFDKIKNKIVALNKGTNENKIIYTILVIYYLKTKCANKLNEYRLVINKANKFLNKNGIDYDNIISGI